MKLEKLDEVRSLLNVAKRLRDIIPQYKKTISDPQCDKHDLKFAGGSDFKAFTCKIGLECYTGYYGNSSCGTMGSIPESYAQKLLIAALNKNMQLILDDMAQAAEDEARKLKQEAEKEIAEANAVLASLT